MNRVRKLTPKIRCEETAVSDLDVVPNKKEDTGGVQVLCRLRPFKFGEKSTSIKLLSPRVLHLKTPAKAGGVPKEVECTFNHIFTGFATQDEVFQHVAYPLLEGLLQEGKNGLLFTYGVTGSGKTYTLAGDHDNPGIMPKCIYTLFNSIGDFQAPKFVIRPDKTNYFKVISKDDVLQKKQNALRSYKTNTNTFINNGLIMQNINQNNLYAVFVSCIEIYNDLFYDLLDEGKTRECKRLREDTRKNMYVNGVVEIEVKTPEEVFELFNIVQKRKRMDNTVFSAVSSISHSIFNIRVVQFQQVAHNEEGQQVVPDGNLLKVSQLSFFDLVGSERTSSTKNTGQLLREASQINKSLKALRNCLEVLRKNQTTGSCEPVPYRDSKLTLLLKDYFEGEGNVRMIVSVNPSDKDFEENIQVMSFAENTKNVQVTATEDRYNTSTLNRRTIYKKGPRLRKNQGVLIIRPRQLNKSSVLHLKESKTALDSVCNVVNPPNDLNRENDVKHENDVPLKKLLVEMQQKYLKEKERASNLEKKLADMEVHHHEELRNIINEKNLIIEKYRTSKKEEIRQIREKISYLEGVIKNKNNRIKKPGQILPVHEDTIAPQVSTPNEPLQDNAQQARKRRSLSAGEIHLEHNSVNTNQKPSNPQGAESKLESRN